MSTKLPNGIGSFVTAPDGSTKYDVEDLIAEGVQLNPTSDQNITGAHALNVTDDGASVKFTCPTGIGPDSVPGNTKAGSQLTYLDVEAPMDASNSTRLANYNLTFRPTQNGGSGSAAAYQNVIDPTTPGPNTDTDVYGVQYTVINEASVPFHDMWGTLILAVNLGTMNEVSGSETQLDLFGATTKGSGYKITPSIGAPCQDFAALRVEDVPADPTNLPNGNYAIKTGQGRIHFGGIPVFANNAAALAGGLHAGDLYRTGADPDPICIVH